MALSDTSTPTSCQEEKGSDCDSPIESNVCDDLSLTKERPFDLKPVSPNSSGQGLPYAPEGWPNPSDVWGWKVLKRTSNAGQFCDRHLYLPKSLQISSHKRQSFRTKRDVERYIESNFPNMGIEAFFGLFSWKIPATKKTPRKVKSLETEEAGNATEQIGTQLKRKIQICSQPTRKSSKLLHLRPRIVPDQDANIVIDLCDQDDEEARVDSTENSKGISDSEEGSAMQTAVEKDPKAINVLENLDTLENSPDHATLDNEIIQYCKKKLSFLLDVDFPSLLSCNDVVVEVATLASQIRKDPTLSVEQLAQVKLVEQLPLVSEAFLEAKGDIEEADKFLGDLEAKKRKVLSLKNDYKEKVAQRESEMDRNTLAIQEIDDQIRQLQSKRSELSAALESMQKGKVELTSGEAGVANSILSLVGEINHGLSEKSKWEMKKANSARRVAEIQKKFINIRGLKF